MKFLNKSSFEFVISRMNFVNMMIFKSEIKLLEKIKKGSKIALGP